MGLVNTLRTQVDTPVWEWTRFAPAASSAISNTCSADNSNFHVQHGRYIYYLIGAASYWRYDTITENYTQLTSPPIAPATWASMKFKGAMGIEGSILAATSNTLTIPAYSGQAIKSFDIRIIKGTGKGQRKIITDVADPIIADTGVPTAVNNVLGAITITDSTKNWAINQWAGYQLRISFGTGVGQVRRILYNSATTLYLADSNLSSVNSWANPGIFSPAITVTAGSQSIYVIESSVVTIDSNWTTIPDATSVFRIESGSIILVSSAAATPFYTIQVHDIATDTWYIKTANTLNVSAVGTDGTIECATENASIWERGTVSAGTTTSLTDSTKSWIPNQWAGYWVRLFAGTAANQLRQISSNTNNTLTWVTSGTAPDATTDYFIDGFDSGTTTSASTTTLVDTTKNWPINRWKNYGIRITGGTGDGQMYPILSNTSNTITVAKPWITTPDTTSNYNIQGDSDKIYIMIGGQAATLIHNYDDDIASYGRLSDSGTARNACVNYSEYKPIAIASATHATTTATITTAFPHMLKVGMSITVKGMTDANYNTTATILTVPSTTTFTYTMAGTPAADTVAGAQSTTTLCDKSKNWTVNQWAGYMVYMTTTAVTAASGLATGQALQIASNTADTLTFILGTAPVNGVSRYIITPRSIIGTLDHGLATGTQSTTTLQDTNKTGTFTGSMASGGYVLTVSTVPPAILSNGMSVTGTSIPTGAVVLEQLTTTMSNGSLGGTGTYRLSMAATALISGATITPGWVVNAYAGRRLKIIGSTGQSQELAIISNTNNTLTFAAATAPVTLVSSYVILQPLPLGVGISLLWLFNLSNSLFKGKYLAVARGGGFLGFNKLNITTDQWEMIAITPQVETLGTGSQYAYDGGDRLYFTKDITLRFYYIDMNTHTIHGAGIVPYAAGTAIIGSRLEIYTTADKLKYLWTNRHSATECFKQLLFY
jgi:hypothetical protein